MTATESDERVLPRRHKDAVFRPVGDEGGLVVLSGRSEVKVLNPVGIKVFSLLDGTNRVEEIARKVADEWDVSVEDALADVEAFVDDLAKNGMLE